MNDQKKRKLGQGMKPRGTNETGAEPEDEVSADAGQQDPENTPEPEVEEDTAGGGRLEPETVEKEAETQTSEKVASEGEKGPVLDQNEDQTQPSGLEEMLRLSVTNDPIVIGLTQGFTPDSTVGEVFGEPVTISAPKSLQNLESERKPQHHRVLTEVDPHTFVFKDGVTDLRPGDIVETIPIFGQQPNGTFGLVVSIPEGYIEGIKLQAKLDNMTTEEWVSFRLGEYLESWFYGK